MSAIPKLGTKDQLDPNGTTPQQDAHNGLVAFYPFGDNQDRPAVISINGDNGGVDIGGTRDKDGKLLLRDRWMTITYIIDGETGTTSQSGDIVLYDVNGKERVRISGKTADMTLKSPTGAVIAHMDGRGGDLTLGGQGQAGDVIVRNAAANETIRLTGSTADIRLGGGGQGGDVVVRNPAGNETIRLAGSDGDITAGGNGQNGDVVVRNSAGNETIRLTGSAGDITLGGGGQGGDVSVRDPAGNETIRLAGSDGDITAGGNGQNGDLVVRNGAGAETIRLAGAGGHVTASGSVAAGVDVTAGHDVTAGSNGQAGDVVVKNAAGSETIRLAGASGGVTADGHVIAGGDLVAGGGGGQAGDVVVKTGGGMETIRLAAATADITVGGNGQHGDLFVLNGAGAETIRLNGELGDIILSNADAAEQFDLVESEDALPGMLMVLNEDGKLEASSLPYDSKVVGVVAGAGRYRPGILLGHRGAPGARVPISVLGKVSCLADATYAPIEVGNLLTTSSTAGHAMKACDRERAFGAVIGKALTPLREGAGLVDMLITLQ